LVSGQPSPTAEILSTARPFAAASPGATNLAATFQLHELTRGLYLRKFALIPSACAVLLLFFSSTFARTQEIDVAVGAGILMSTKNTTASQAFLPPPEKGGLYPSFSFERIFTNRFGYSAELATSYKQQSYNSYQGYRPIFYDVNAVFASQLYKKINADFMAGIGGESIRFYNPYGNCNFSAGCTTHLDSNHLLFHLGADVRYTVWRRFFVRPEAHLYHIVNNAEFHSDNVLRVGGSIGYTFSRK
jgi:hypothetical protein